MTLRETDLIVNADGSIYHLHLRPGDVAEKIILVGDPGRVVRVSRHFDQIDHKSHNREFITHTGTCGGKRISVMSTGIGTDNIEIALIELDALFNIDLQTREIRRESTSLELVRIGTSGGIQADIPVGTLLAAGTGVGFDNLMNYYTLHQNEEELAITSAMQRQCALGHQPYLARPSQKLLERIAHDMHIGNTATTPGFYAPQGRLVRTGVRNPTILKTLQEFDYYGFRLSNFEMETSAIYALSTLLGHQALSVNVVLANRPAGKFSHSAYMPMDDAIARVLERI